ncbi:MAG TPA: hypothetical protein VFO94_18945 [Gammaproteobacteria bacterium]|jgi:hypothetical protein|nr:hypothetical protein [Gammaproteobacteria bacterium]
MTRSTLDPDNLPVHRDRKAPPGHTVRSLGPSDSTDSGSDLAGPGVLDADTLGLDRGTNEDSEGGHADAIGAGADIGDREMDENSDRYGTGERMAAGQEPNVEPGADIGFDRVVGPNEAGLGGGLDQAEEAQLGITDEEIDEQLGRDRDE